MNKMTKRIIFLLLAILLFALIIWVRDEWFQYLNSDERVPGRDTAAFWNPTEEGFEYQILHDRSGFVFCAYDSPFKGTIPYQEIDNVHFYADTADYIFIITDELRNYCIEKKTGTIFSSSCFDMVPSTEAQVCFVNLQTEKLRFSKTY